MSSKKSIHWFRQDLRLFDNPGLLAAFENGSVLPVYILDDKSAAEFQMGAASRWWLHYSLQSLNRSLNDNLLCLAGDPETLIKELIEQYEIGNVTWNRCYEPWRIARDKIIKSELTQAGVEVLTFNASLLWEPWQVLKKDKTPYRVFTPYYRRGCLAQAPPREPLPAPESMQLIAADDDSNDISSLELLPDIGWDKKLEKYWQIGEEGAHQALEDFLDEGIADYKEGRNFPARKNVSRLSPRLHFGEISPNQIWYATRARSDDENTAHFCTELGWREFAHSLLYFFPELPRKNLQERFNEFPWQENPEHLRLWQQGQTGYPIVDAGMRELWETGLMHNRVRMIVGSFLVKNLLLHWHHGERWFWDCLVDADLANNSAGWQWIAGCGADAAPYFRVFNPVTQGQRFDAAGDYTLQYVPELKELPEKYLFCPWAAPEEVLEDAHITLGKDYPFPIVDIKLSRERALQAFKSTRQAKPV